ncbi:MAG: glycosyltransferase [Bacteroidales bacterium]
MGGNRLNLIFDRRSRGMKLSVIIVSYNVCHFLEQCLLSVQTAMKGVDGEVWVVDNHSADGSVAMVRKRFPEVKVIANKENRGFSYANNQAIEKSAGEYVLLLNPDTVVEEDTFQKVVSYMDNHPEAGALGVKMFDGNGKFLPESKRGLPTPMVAFYKIFGLSALFPKSKTFGRYHLGFLNPDEIHEVDVLSGAFMLLRRSALEKTGLLDETFFMYGEDIDLSYRIQKAGYKNIYFPHTRIIHYKGESTKKSSINYVLVFYRAMVIFARKHFSAKNARLFSVLINLAIWFRAFLAILNRWGQKALLPLLDLIILGGGLILIKNYWETQVLPGGKGFPEEIITIALPFYLFIWLLSVYIRGGYDIPVRIGRALEGVGLGTVVILIIYALLPEHIRFSRAVILFGALWGVVTVMSVRWGLHFSGLKRFRLGTSKNRRCLIAARPDEAHRVAQLIRHPGSMPGFIGFAVPVDEEENDGVIGTIDQIPDLVKLYDIDEVIFCSRDISPQKIIDIMSGMTSPQPEFRIAPPETTTIIGSQSIKNLDDAFIFELDPVWTLPNRRSKRVLDLLVCLTILPLSPILLFLVNSPAGVIRNWWQVVLGKKTWVGYNPSGPGDPDPLPKTRIPVLTPADMVARHNPSAETARRLNLIYARNYSTGTDLHIIFRCFRLLGR